MTKQLLNKQSLQGLSNGLIAIAVIYGVYKLSQGLNRMDKAAEIATQPIGQAWSDASAWLGGYRPVEVTDLVIQPWYMIGNQISDDAYEVLLRNYPDLLPQLFDGRTLKREYRHLIGKPIGGL
ncbi:hypothetical protein BEL05_04880 [Shewanella colwelliana]|uniref:Uncharacterized protein n=1 Tax=Shewanella colwelliana TaxID=23 RepID=A0A1E5IP79_SHECO|nr:hypothetical protein [Shewanella colwelliana]OEG72315.1 hypothetical protein BEL05_04880 [Shewanella colwelliana]